MQQDSSGFGLKIFSLLVAAGLGVFVGAQMTSGKASGDGVDCDSPMVKACSNDEPVYKVELGDARVKGPKDALVTIIEISDFECPFCSKVGPTLKDLTTGKYAKDVRVAFFHNPLSFHKNAMNAALAAEAAGNQDKFWEMHDKLFANQKALKMPDLEKYAEELGLDLAKFQTDMKDEGLKKKIKDQQALARKLGAGGTPSFFINGRKLSGAQPLEKFEELVELGLTLAKMKVAKGVAPENVYAELIKDGATERVRAKNKFDPKAQPKRPARPPEKRIDLTATQKAPRGKGAWPAKVHIIEWSDFECPYCIRGAEVVEEIMKNYPKDVYFEYRHNPLGFHKNAEAAAIAAEAAGRQGKFFPMHDELFKTPRGGLNQARYDAIAKKIGLDMGRFKKDMEDPALKTLVKAQQADGMKIGARGTPNFFVNGVPVRGAMPFASFKTIIDAELKKVDAEIKKGTPLAEAAAAVAKAEAGKSVGGGAPGGAPPKPKGPVKIKNHPMDVGFGPENAAVTIYEFSDFECPFCEKGARVVEQIKKTYGNKVRFVFKHLPLSFHKNAELAARAAQAANNQGKFWEMHDALFDNYRQLSPAKIDELAKGIAGMNFAKWEQDRESKAIKDKVAADKAEANRTGTRGTPNFYINGENIAGALPFETFKAKIDAALKKKGG